MKLETDRLILRDFVKEDRGWVLEYQSNPLYLRYYEWMERTPEAVQEFVGWFLEHQKQKPRISLMNGKRTNKAILYNGNNQRNYVWKILQIQSLKFLSPTAMR